MRTEPIARPGRGPTRPIHRLLLLVTAAACLGLPRPAAAGLVISAPTGVAASAGSFDLTIRNTDSTTTYDVSGDSIKLDLTGGSGVHFTGATTGTAMQYLFMPGIADTFEGGSLGSSSPDTSITIADNDFSNRGFTAIAPGATFGLARIFFSVDAAAPAAVVNITIDQANSSFSGPAGDGASLVDFTTQPGTLIVTSAAPVATPEPSSFVLAAIGAGCVVGVRYRQARRRVGPAR